MRQALFIFLLFIFSIGNGLAQKNSSQKIPTANPIEPSPFNFELKMSLLDSGTIRILYALNATDIRKPETYDDLQRLEIGSHVSKYYGFYVFNSDSLVSNWRKKDVQENYYQLIAAPNSKGVSVAFPKEIKLNS